MFRSLRHRFRNLRRKLGALLLRGRCYTAKTRILLDKAAGARDVAGTLRRAISTVRLYGLEHNESKEAIGALYKLLRAYLNVSGDITFTVEPGSLVFNGRLVLKETGDDWMIGMLFSDGIASITFHSVLKEDSLREYLKLWNAALEAPNDPERSFASRAWEAHLPGITTRLRWAFGDFSGSAEDELRRHYAMLLHAIREVGVNRRSRSTKSTLADIEGYIGSESKLNTGTTSPPRPIELNDHELNAMQASLAASSRGAGQRVLLRLWHAFKTLDDVDQNELVELAAAMIDGLAQVGRTNEIVRAFTRITSFARGDASAEARLDSFLVALGNERVVSTLVTQVAQPESEHDVLFLLRELPSKFAEQLLEPLIRATPEVREKIAPILQTKKIEPEQAAFWLFVFGDRLGEYLIDVTAKMSPFHLDAAVRVALLHDSVPLRQKALSAIEPMSAERYRSLIEQNTEHADPNIRLAAVELSAHFADQHAVELFTRHLAAPDNAVAIHKISARALGTIGGNSAAVGLVKAFRERRPREVRLALAQALAMVPGEEAQTALEEEIRRWFGDRELRATCKTALRRRRRHSPHHHPISP